MSEAAEMWARARTRAAAGDGSAVLWVVIASVMAIFGVVGFVLLGVLGGDTDRYGRVAVPGGQALELEEGELADCCA